MAAEVFEMSLSEIEFEQEADGHERDPQFVEKTRRMSEAESEKRFNASLDFDRHLNVMMNTSFSGGAAGATHHISTTRRAGTRHVRGGGGMDESFGEDSFLMGESFSVDDGNASLRGAMYMPPTVSPSPSATKKKMFSDSRNLAPVLDLEEEDDEEEHQD